jgi:hypothetical protein
LPHRHIETRRFSTSKIPSPPQVKTYVLRGPLPHRHIEARRFSTRKILSPPQVITNVLRGPLFIHHIVTCSYSRSKIPSPHKVIYVHMWCCGATCTTYIPKRTVSSRPSYPSKMPFIISYQVIHVVLRGPCHSAPPPHQAISFLFWSYE